MSFKIKITLKQCTPRTTRTIAVQPGTRLQELADIFVTAMGWGGGRDHSFRIDAGTDAERALTDADEKTMVVDDLLDRKCIFTYDSWMKWQMDMEFQKDIDIPGPRVVRYKWDCPHQVFSGPKDWSRISKAAADPSDAYHDQASAWMSMVDEYDMDAVNEDLANGTLATTPAECEDGDSVTRVLNAMKRLCYMSVPDLRFRCPFCGSTCDGRVDLDLPFVSIRMKQLPSLRAICPGCRNTSIIRKLNDGYVIGYTDDRNRKAQSEITPLYDLLLDKDAERDDVEEARYQARLALEYARSDSMLDNFRELKEARDRLDPSEVELRDLCLAGMIALHRPKNMRFDDDILDAADEAMCRMTGTTGAMVISRMGGIIHRNDGEAIGKLIG